MKLTCKDINPESTCEFSTGGATAEDAANKMMEHAKAEHAEDLAKMDMDDAAKLEMMMSKAHQ